MPLHPDSQAELGRPAHRRRSPTTLARAALDQLDLEIQKIHWFSTKKGRNLEDSGPVKSAAGLVRGHPAVGVGRMF